MTDQIGVNGANKKTEGGHNRARRSCDSARSVRDPCMVRGLLQSGSNAHSGAGRGRNYNERARHLSTSRSTGPSLQGDRRRIPSYLH